MAKPPKVGDAKLRV